MPLSSSLVPIVFIEVHHIQQQKGFNFFLLMVGLPLAVSRWVFYMVLTGGMLVHKIHSTRTPIDAVLISMYLSSVLKVLKMRQLGCIGKKDHSYIYNNYCVQEWTND